MKRYKLVAGLFVLLWLQACSVGGNAPLRSVTEQSTIRSVLADYYRQWQGTPYQWGGQSRQGVDCSGLVSGAYQTGFGIALPRTTAAQLDLGASVKRDALQVGDLVFFKTGFKQRHVGIYMGSNRFMHASTSQGVTMTSLENPYWKQRYWQAKRLPIALQNHGL